MICLQKKELKPDFKMDKNKKIIIGAALLAFGGVAYMKADNEINAINKDDMSMKFLMGCVAVVGGYLLYKGIKQ